MEGSSFEWRQCKITSNESFVFASSSLKKKFSKNYSFVGPSSKLSYIYVIYYIYALSFWQKQQQLAITLWNPFFMDYFHSSDGYNLSSFP